MTKKGILLLVVFWIAGTFPSAAQDMEETLALRGLDTPSEQLIPLEKSLNQLEDQFDVTFIYKAKLIKGKEVPEHEIRIGNIHIVLNQLLKPLNLTYEQVGARSLVILTKEQARTRKDRQKMVQGTVTDRKTGQALPGANVLIKGTSRGTSTDKDGNYSLGVPSLSDTLVFSFTGYESQTVPINGRTEINVALQPKVFQAKELVVVGYGTQEEHLVSSSVSQIDGAQIAQKNIADPRQALQGLAPGVAVVDRGGPPGHTSIAFNIRGRTTIGSTSPLILVNGIQQDFSDLNPNNIASITVLKDAAAKAIYGSRGANGVILVTTKDAQPGELDVTYHGYLGISKISQKPEHLGLEAYLRLRNTAFANRPGGEPIYTEKYIQEYVNADNRYKYPWPHPWYREGVLFQEGPVQNHSLTFSGGTEQLTARLNLNYAKENGIMPNFSSTKKQVRLDTDLDLSDRIHVSMGLTYRMKNIREPEETGGYANLYWGLWHNNEFVVPQYPDGTYGVAPGGVNPLMNAEISGIRNQKYDYFVANFKAEVQLMEGLKFTTQFGGHIGHLTTSEFSREFTVRDYYTNEIIYETDPNSLREHRNRGAQWTWKALLNYNLDLKNHRFEFLAGFEQMWDELQWTQSYRNQFYNNSLRVLNAGSEENWSNSGSAWNQRLRSVFGRIRYVYANKYIFTASARYDGSSKFAGADNQYSFFPSFSAAWRISEEEFWESIEPVVSNLKLRGSWGQTGNNTVARYTFFQGYSIGTNYSFGGQLVRTAYSYDLVNRNLSWETTAQWNVGVDVEFWQGLLSLTFDYYQKRTEGVLLTLPIPDIIGLNAPPQNAGRVDNTGWGISITHQNNIGEDFSYSIQANLSNFHNEVVSLARTGPYFPFATVTKVGEPLGALWGYKALGLFQSEEEIANYPTWAPKDNVFPGDIKYADLNGDGEITPDDKTVIGYQDPHYSFGITTSVNFKNFDLSFFIQGVGQQDRITTGAARECGNWGNFTLALCADYWTPENRDARIPRPQASSRKNTTYNVNSSWWVIDASYMKLKNLQFGYTLPTTLTEKFGVNRLRIYVSGTDLLTFSEATKWGMDPEFRSGRLDYYPQTSRYIIGIDLNF